MPRNRSIHDTRIIAAMRGRLRKFWALLSIGAILFAQAAVAAYPCPAPMEQARAASMEVPCEQMDMQAPPLCQKHCQDEKQKPHDSTLDVLVPDFTPAFSTRIEEPAAPNAEPRLSAHLQAPPPPLILRNCCLRI